MRRGCEDGRASPGSRAPRPLPTHRQRYGQDTGKAQSEQGRTAGESGDQCDVTAGLACEDSGRLGRQSVALDRASPRPLPGLPGRTALGQRQAWKPT